ncbi:MAG TPA: dihydropteroate synthase [Spirochaetia bacterium]|nr:dihydropteroate synthase [Spirochaetia bacterium]
MAEVAGAVPARRIPLPRGRFLDLARGPLVMGILNSTPDSFYPASRSGGGGQGAEAARVMIDEGADIIDVGGESTRPGADYVDADEELRRVIPIITGIRAFSDLPLSIDTRKARVAERALDAGADIVNDVSALRDDPEMAGVIALRGVPVVLMHRRGSSKTMQKAPRYDDTSADVRAELAEFVARALSAGIPPNRIILDPGIGFGKRLEDNLILLRAIPLIKGMGYPVLIGLSRKSFIGTLTGGRPVEERLAGSIAANSYAVLAGADILRVHDVAQTADACKVLHAIMTISTPHT